jgi:hypothetical protein
MAHSRDKTLANGAADVLLDIAVNSTIPLSLSLSLDLDLDLEQYTQ